MFQTIFGQESERLSPTLHNQSWLSGTWKGEAFGGQVEEIWSEPMGDSMMASFKLIIDGKVKFYEFEIIRQLKDSLILQLKHFDTELMGWEDKRETVDFPLKNLTADKIEFERMYLKNALIGK